MSARESDQILVRFLRRAKTRTKARHRTFLEGDHLRHRLKDTPRPVNFLSNARRAPKTKAAAPFGTAAREALSLESLELVRHVVEGRAQLRADVLHVVNACSPRFALGLER